MIVNIYLAYAGICCRFDKIISKEIPSTVVFEDDKVLFSSITFFYTSVSSVASGTFSYAIL